MISDRYTEAFEIWGDSYTQNAKGQKIPTGSLIESSSGFSIALGSTSVFYSNQWIQVDTYVEYCPVLNSTVTINNTLKKNGTEYIIYSVLTAVDNHHMEIYYY